MGGVSDGPREEELAELARRVGVHVPGLVRVKLMLVDAGGERQLVTLEQAGAWKLEPRAPGGELMFLQSVGLVGVEPADRGD